MEENCVWEKGLRKMSGTKTEELTTLDETAK
jgi:hypothetical protein